MRMLNLSRLVVPVLLLLYPHDLAAQNVTPDPEAYHRAVDYCRGDVPQPTAISPDRTIVCFSEQTDLDVDVSTVNPRYHVFFKTKIIYESYPESQDEVDALAARHRLGRVIHDP
ncbi:hypothetical protein [Bradyrhizobium sp. SZCCHNR1093]|uniref:hypothetical protein n=1 Tax=Bradyrhizobium sp. SZCCHNR1093 TaxID=3057368 RepID=UPI0028E5BDB9|nr:hypothetical protein [Bradyrhizobium sp. SZCCHNR1093]